MGNQTIKKLHANQIIKLVKESGPISRIEISEKINIPQPTITRITEELLKMNIIKEKGFAPSSGGRRPILLDFNENCYYSLGFEIGRTSMKLALTNLNGEILAFRKKSYQSTNAIDDILLFSKNSVTDMLEESGVNRDRLLGMGVGLPGPLYLDEHNLKSPNFMKGELTNLPRRLKEYFNFPIEFDKDANVAALAEKWFGKGVGCSNFIYVMADEGIGCGIFLKNQLYRGVHGEAGGLGHSVVDLFGAKCTCGNYGCLETLVSKEKIIDKVKSQLKLATNEERSMYFQTDIEDVTIKNIRQAAEKGSLLAQQVLRESGVFLGVGLSNIVTFFDPELIILGGSIGSAHDVIKDSVTNSITERVLGTYGKNIKITLSNIEESTALGAAALIIDKNMNLFSNHSYILNRAKKDSNSIAEIEN
ncbi:ROK family protein [Radiobacillus sp. PE A8.2]|uniref:ROK family transcriptional regulator n=1 Tax=Radiobacillus sp. PE A8.2 TaxID=3380349 RepID=UPI00388F1734